MFAIAAGTSYNSRPLMSVAVLSVFVVPMTEAFGWSRGLFAGAVSLGGLCAVAISPVAGRLVDRYGAGLMIGVSSAIAGACAIGLSAIASVWSFYAVYVPGRMVFAGPLELAPTAAISNWFVRRRAFVLALYGISQGTGLAAMPFIAQLLITGWGWRGAWTALGIYTLAVGVVPALVLMVRRPEDMGFAPDGLSTSHRRSAGQYAGDVRDTATSVVTVDTRESHFTLGQALRTRAFWVLSAFSAVGFMVQAGVSLHQVSHYIHQALSAPTAALSASVFALAQVPRGCCGRRWYAICRCACCSPCRDSRWRSVPSEQHSPSLSAVRSSPPVFSG